MGAVGGLRILACSLTLYVRQLDQHGKNGFAGFHVTLNEEFDVFVTDREQSSWPLTGICSEKEQGRHLEPLSFFWKGLSVLDPMAPKNNFEVLFVENWPLRLHNAKVVISLERPPDELRRGEHGYNHRKAYQHYRFFSASSCSSAHRGSSYYTIEIIGDCRSPWH